MADTEKLKVGDFAFFYNGRPECKPIPGQIVDTAFDSAGCDHEITHPHFYFRAFGKVGGGLIYPASRLTKMTDEEAALWILKS